MYVEMGNGAEYKTQTIVPLTEGSLAGLEGREMELEEGSEGGMLEAMMRAEGIEEQDRGRSQV